MDIRILIVDDEQVYTDSLAEFFASQRWAVRTAGTVRAAIDAAKVFRPEIILTDLNLPDATCLHLVDSLRSMGDHSLIVIVTAYGEVATVWKSLRLRVDGFVTKPVNFDELKVTLIRLLEARRSSAA